jgi:uncharacterized protein (TIGR02611 family)
MSIRSPRQRAIRRVVTATVGFTLLIAGILMLVLPGPGIVVILAALTLLATEFHWARRLKRRVVVWLRKRTKKRADKVNKSAGKINEVTNKPVTGFSNE